jgi:transposase InsO family protein
MISSQKANKTKRSCSSFSRFMTSIVMAMADPWVAESLSRMMSHKPSRRMVDYLAREGIPISRDRARNLMRRMGLRAIYRKPRTTIPGDPAERFPCLVDLDAVTAVDQVWAADITYITLQKGFLYLVAIVDLFSRTIHSFGEAFGYSWKLS